MDLIFVILDLHFAMILLLLLCHLSNFTPFSFESGSMKNNKIHDIFLKIRYFFLISQCPDLNIPIEISL